MTNHDQTPGKKKKLCKLSGDPRGGAKRGPKLST